MKKLILLLLFTCCIGSISAEETQTEQRPVQNRFLFVLESTSAMDRCSKAAAETICNLVASGVQGQMKPGDTFGLWTFNEKLDTSFPMQQWLPSESEKLSTAASDFLKKRRYEKKANMRAMLGPLYPVIRSSRAITVILVSTGNDPIQGTPFDNQINSIYPVYARELRKEKLPFVTILVGRNGRIVAHAVNSAPGPIQIPNPPIEPLPVVKPKTTDVLATTNKVTEPLRKIAKSNIIITKESIAKESAQPLPTVTPAAPQVAEDGPRVVPTTSPALSVESSSENSVEEAKAPDPNPAAIQQAATVPIAEVPNKKAQSNTPAPEVASENPSTFEPEAQKVGGTGKTENEIGKPTTRFRNESTPHNTIPIKPDQMNTPTQSASAVIVATKAETKGNKHLAIGLLLVALAIALTFFIVRSTRSKPGPSIISRSMDDRK